ncbi:MAG: alpha/beta hydrolase [Chloroflexota bacterium]|nr:alpha/beta hydrolase [Chloroflexota bacterium]
MTTLPSAPSTPTPRRRWIKNRRDLLSFIGVFAVVSLAISVGAFLVWTANPAQPGAIALRTMTEVTMTIEDGMITFVPTTPRDLGFIFYPGALVSARAYAPILAPLAQAGYLVVTTEMPLNLAVFDTAAADRLRAAHPQITRWAIGGHSLGGAMASNYARDRGDLAGLALLASAPDKSVHDLPLPTLYVYGDRDGLRTAEELNSVRSLLPADTEYVLIEGANHAQFGDYGAQFRDLEAMIPAQTQWDATVAALLRWLERAER